jgi:ribonucleoside-diphosphate reductase alpha chain
MPGPTQQTRRNPLALFSTVYSALRARPYEAINWERRDVVQTNWKTGETVFRQRGVEFPDFCSVNASTIVTTTYFRGAVGTDLRE